MKIALAITGITVAILMFLTIFVMLRSCKKGGQHFEDREQNKSSTVTSNTTTTKTQITDEESMELASIAVDKF